MKTYAINLADLMYPDRTLMAQILIAPVSREVVRLSKDELDSEAVILNCDEERAQAIVDVIRLKYKRHELRCYVKDKGWKAI